MYFLPIWTEAFREWLTTMDLNQKDIFLLVFTCGKLISDYTLIFPLFYIALKGLIFLFSE